MTLPVQPILQFGTSRFLLAHADLFVSEAMALGTAGEAVGGITIVQTTANPASIERVAALAGGAGYPVRIRGLSQGERIDSALTGHAVREALRADTDWPRVREAIAGPVRIIISNTADRGYELDPRDGPEAIDGEGAAHAPPHSFPAKLLALLWHRWQRQPAAPLSIYPCELISRNGDALRTIVSRLARQWGLLPEFDAWVHWHCVWANSLVDRIVAEPLHPVGAIAEPYALWAIERKPRLVLPCRHPAIVLTDKLEHYERLKLYLLNGGHTWLAERWRVDRRAGGETVLQAMNDPALRADLEGLWRDEMLPVFAAVGEKEEALAYLEVLRERLLNPFLAHRLSEIAQNHVKKKQRRFAPVIALAEKFGLGIAQPRLRAALAARA
jgi:tagaturonate reductase